jgi:hypothetical protein
VASFDADVDVFDMAAAEDEWELEEASFVAVE